MKRVKIYTPEIKRTQKGKSVEVEITKKKGTFVKEISVMDRTFDEQVNGGDAMIIHRNQYFELVKVKALTESDLKKLNEDELLKKAIELKVEDPSDKKEGLISQLINKSKELLNL